MSFVIAIDGPAASGKGTLARRLATELGFHHLDTGLLYRGVALSMLHKGYPLDDEERATQIASTLDLSGLDRDILSDHRIGEAASKVAVMPKVRAALLQAQRGFAGQAPGAVLDGRDIATVVFPEADVKLFVTANTQVRAWRRFKEAEAKGDTTSFEEIHADIEKRDARDKNRTDAPLVVDPDAHLIDTSEMSIEAAFQTVLGIVEKTRGV
ncbi:MAG: (d)CMP kinase [Pseudomonadota bacterium]